MNVGAPPSPTRQKWQSRPGKPHEAALPPNSTVHADDGCAQLSLRLLGELLTQAAAIGLSGEGHSGEGESGENGTHSEGRENTIGVDAVEIVGASHDVAAMWRMTASKLLPQVSPSLGRHCKVPDTMLHSI